jgi:hypothetical protein
MIPQSSLHEVLPRSEIEDIRKYVDKVDTAQLTKKRYLNERVTRAAKYFKPKCGFVAKKGAKVT